MSALWLLLAGIVAMLGLLTAGATAVRSASRVWLRHWVERRLAGPAPGGPQLERPQRLLLGATAAGALLTSGAGLLIGAHQAPGWERLAYGAGFLLAALMFGQWLPRAAGRRWAGPLVPILLPLLRAVAPAVAPLVRAAQALARPFAGRTAPAAPAARHEEIEDMLRQGELEGIGEPEEIEVITGVVQFGERVLRDVMTPRTEMFALDIDADPRETAQSIAQSGYSRVPVYHGSLDEIAGFIHAFDVLKAGGETLPPIRQVAFAPDSKRASEMLFEMLRGQRMMAIVLDEFGGTAGLVTLEDLLEELVGDIRDEHDDPADPVLASAPRGALVDGSEELGEVARRFGSRLAGGDELAVHTVGGILARALGRIPVVGERFRLNGLEVTVVEAEPARVTRVLVQRADTAAPIDVTLPA